MDGLSIVIIGYNEEHNISNIIAETDKVLSQINIPYEIIAVNDGSKDKTGELINNISEQNKHVKALHHDVNQGMGASIHDGYTKAQYNLISYLPADGQIPPSTIKSLYEAVKDVDYVVTVYSGRKDSFIRKFISFGLRVYIFILFGRFPKIDGVYMFRKHVFENINLISKTFVYNFEFIIRAYKKNYHHNTVNIFCLPRNEGESKVVSYRKIFKVLKEFLILRIRMFAE